MPVEKGKKLRAWHCSICGRVYARRDTTRREILNKWWKHMKKFHPKIYVQKKKAAVKKAVATRKKRRKR